VPRFFLVCILCHKRHYLLMKHNTLNSIHFINDIMEVKIPTLHFEMAMILFRVVRVFSTIDLIRYHSSVCILKIRYPCEGVSVVYVYYIKLYYIKIFLITHVFCRQSGLVHLILMSLYVARCKWRLPH